MLQSGTVRRAAALVGIHRNTSFRWRHRFLHSAKQDRNVPLDGVTEADETYLLESQKGSRQLDRPPRRRGGKARRRGLSHEHDCILVARDRSGRTVDFVTGRAPLKPADLQRCLRPVIAPDIMLVTDGHPAYPAFARQAGIAHRAVKRSAGVRVAGKLHVQNVDAYHSRFKQWLRRFNGVAAVTCRITWGGAGRSTAAGSARRKSCSERRSALCPTYRCHSQKKSPLVKAG
jgi:transposase-like protein